MSIEPYGATPAKKERTDTSGAASKSAGEHRRDTNRPTYDVVEEYIKSLDVYRSQCHPTEERVSTIILQIADFLLEFATLGHEVSADVPGIVHPILPSEDLKAIGVPHVTLDDAGRSVLWYPEVYPQLGVWSLATRRRTICHNMEVSTKPSTIFPSALPTSSTAGCGFSIHILL